LIIVLKKSIFFDYRIWASLSICAAGGSGGLCKLPWATTIMQPRRRSAGVRRSL